MNHADYYAYDTKSPEKVTITLGYYGSPSGYESATVTPHLQGISGGGFHNFKVKTHRTGLAAIRRAYRLTCSGDCRCDGCHVSISTDEKKRLLKLYDRDYTAFGEFVRGCCE